jgi:large subunit ribosomal protein L29
MKIEKIRELTGDELQLKLKELQEELFNLRFQISTGQASNPLRLRTVRRDIARFMTRLQQLKPAR